jgi:hypothetical protein
VCRKSGSRFSATRKALLPQIFDLNFLNRVEGNQNSTISKNAGSLGNAELAFAPDEVYITGPWIDVPS